MDLVFIFVLIVINGIFAMSEIAIVSSRSARLQRLVDEGKRGAAAAFKLHGEPSRFLSTIQVGITSVGILNGAVGETALADPIAAWLRTLPVMADYARGIALAFTVVVLTYFSVVVGELVPKRLALLAPERFAAVISVPMTWLAKITRPLVWLFSASGDLVLRLFKADRGKGLPVTDEEIEVLMEQGAEAGIFHESEQAIVSNVLRLDELTVAAIMTPRTDLYSVDLHDPEMEIRRAIADSPHNRIVVCEDGLDNVIGILQRGDLLAPALAGQDLDVRSVMRPPVFVPRSVSTTHVLESMRRTRTQSALAIDEYGTVQGIVTLNDIFAAIVGDMPEESGLEQDLVQRDDGSWLVGGGVTVDRLKGVLELEAELPGEEDNVFHSVGGFLMHALGRVPRVTDRFDSHGWRFEVVDMDGRRVDKVLVARHAANAKPVEKGR